MAEVNWDDVGTAAAELLDTLNQVKDVMCGASYYKACMEISEKIVPIIKRWKAEADAGLRLGDFTSEHEGEVPEAPALTYEVTYAWIGDEEMSEEARIYVREPMLMTATSDKEALKRSIESLPENVVVRRLRLVP
jgi:hypothetical protein